MCVYVDLHRCVHVCIDIDTLTYFGLIVVSLHVRSPSDSPETLERKDAGRCPARGRAEAKAICVIMGQADDFTMDGGPLEHALFACLYATCAQLMRAMLVC